MEDTVMNGASEGSETLEDGSLFQKWPVHAAKTS